MESVRTSGFSYSHQPPLPLTTYGVMVCPAHRRAGADAVWGRGSGYTDAWLFALHHLPVFSCYQVSFLFSSQKKRKPPHFSRSTAMKSDTSGRGLPGGGGPEEEIADGISGCILGIQLNEAVCFLGNHLSRCQTTHPLTPPLSKAPIPTAPASPACFHTFFFAALSHVLKGVLCYWVEAFSLRV